MAGKTAPALKARNAGDPQADLTSMVLVHRAIRDDLRRLATCLEEIADRGAPPSRVRDLLDEHIADEEEYVLPAMRRYLPAEAYRWCEKQIRCRAPMPGRRFTAPWRARHARPDELSRLLAGRGWPARIMLTATRPGYARLEHRAFGR
jgi:hypothetical protein